MPSNSFGEFFRITTFGESHGKAIGVVIDGVKPCVKVDLEAIQRELKKRRPGKDEISSPRNEPDDLTVLSGIFEGKTTGAPICFVIYNKDTKSEDYEKIKNLFRPGHADFAIWKKYGIRDYRGGGRTSGRETACRVAAGAFAKQLLEQEGIEIFGFVKEIYGIKAEIFDKEEINRNSVKCPDPAVSKQMENAIKQAINNNDSVGGIVEIRVRNVPSGLGDPVFDKLNARIGQALLSIPAVKGVEFGDGFALARMKGSEANDCMNRKGFLSNHGGGISGGISTGQEIIIRIVVKPTSSINKEQKTLDINGHETTFTAGGRHDPCICPRIAPIAESMVALVILDTYLKQKAITGKDVTLEDIRALIEGCDNVILESLARRIKFSKIIAELKKNKKGPIKSKKQEENVISHFKLLARELDLDALTAEKCAKFVIQLSKQS